MPKLPRQDTKHSAMPATSGGVISGRMIVRSTVSGRAPPASPASISSCGSVRRPARSVRNTSGAYCTPSSSTMPCGEYSGLRLPIGGARPSMLAAACSTGRTSAARRAPTTCGASISGSTKQKTNALRARMSVSADGERDDGADQRREQRAGRARSTRLCAVAVHVAGCRQHAHARRRTTTRRRAQRLDDQPHERQQRQDARRPRRAPTAAPAPRRARAGRVVTHRRGGRSCGGRMIDQLPNSSAKRFRLALFVCTTLAMSVGIRLILRAGRQPRRHADAGARRDVAHRDARASGRRRTG